MTAETVEPGIELGQSLGVQGYCRLQRVEQQAAD